ncbi:MAG: nucleotidyltransferase family protein [Candidatus Methanoperedens sp.]|nr:nucleotidyltransferase family protein [Candidatus Methanoperedens sp.]MCZ7406438.1 nucleotidyltransferase family protein [Candidatus Methanoperedens sp.]
MKTLEEIKKIIKNQKPVLREKYSVRQVGIFGSYVRGEQKKKSDVDILVEFEKPISLLKLVNLENFLADVMGIKVDVVPKEDIRHELKEKILREVVYI